MAWDQGNAGYKIDAGNKQVLGTCVLTELDAFGTVESCSITTTGEELEVLDCIGALKAFLVTNPGYELQFTCIMDADVDAPDMLTEIEFPYAGVYGVIVPGTAVSWEQKGIRKLNVKAKAWNSLVLTGDNSDRYVYDGTIWDN